MKKTIILSLAAGSLWCVNAQNKITFTPKDGYVEVSQTHGPTLGYNPAGGARIIIVDSLAFKSFNGSDTLLPYEDWRLPAQERAADLARRMSIDQIAGLMLYSPQNKIPMLANDTYSGKKYTDSGAQPWDLSDGQLKFLLEDNVRHVLVSKVESPEAAARWNNNIQALAENNGLGIPANNSSDPRHSAFADAEFAPGASGQLSLWSNLMGLASTFSPETVREFADIARQEYRALGLATALSPQADLGTDPRWYRFNSTFGNDPVLVADLIKAYCDGLQSSPENTDGNWGVQSVNAMVKHWPGGGSGEGGRDAHYGNGKFAVYPGGCYEAHKFPFTHGAFRLDGATGSASAVMPYYTVSYGQSRDGQQVGNSYSSDIITSQLRNEAGFQGVVCTDWVITDNPVDPSVHWSKPWGVETLTVPERHYKALMAGVDQFGGNQDKEPIVRAYEMGVAQHGEEWMRNRMEQSATRLLLNILRPGLFENPYVDVEKTKATVGRSQWMERGYDQQLRSVILLKNHDNLLPLRDKLKVYVPQRNLPPMRTYWGNTEPARTDIPVPPAIADKYYQAVNTPEEADVAIVFMDSPKSHRMGYDPADKEKGGNGYIPITLQYRPYTAVDAREHSIARDPWDGNTDRSYRGKTVHALNECELDLLEETRRAMGTKPVIVVMSMSNPTVMTEVEPLADALLVGFSVQAQAYLDLITGAYTPSGLLPFEMPASMSAVERHNEDQPHDIEPYVDKDGNTYRFGYGLNFSGPISDNRTQKYVK